MFEYEFYDKDRKNVFYASPGKKKRNTHKVSKYNNKVIFCWLFIFYFILQTTPNIFMYFARAFKYVWIVKV